MLIVQILLIAVGLSMDAFAVSVTNGLVLKKTSQKQALRIAVAFGGFQALMPLLGFLLGSVFSEFILSFDHYVALIFLGFIGGKMLFDGLKKSEDKTNISETLPLWSLIIQAVATSIDALIIGISFIAMGIKGFEIAWVIAVIGAVTFVLCLIGFNVGKKFGNLLGSKSKILGGLILIGIGLKVFLEHTLVK